MTLTISIRVHIFLAAFFLFAGGLQAAAQTPNALLRLRALHLPHLDGHIPHTIPPALKRWQFAINRKFPLPPTGMPAFDQPRGTEPG